MKAEIRFEVEQVLALYCHAVDRCDLTLLRKVFWDDALADYGTGPVPAPEFCAGLVTALRSMELTQHNVGNVWLKIAQDGLSARVQSYCVAHHILEEDMARKEMEIGGRYLDRFEIREGEWRISSRKYVMDWNRNGEPTRSLHGGLYDKLAHRGTRDAADPSVVFLA